MEFTFAAAARSPISDELAIGGKLLHSVIAKLADIDVAFAVEFDTVGITELSRLLAFLAPHLQPVAFRIKNLDAMVTSVGNPDVVFIIDGDPLRSHELAGTPPVRAPLQNEITFGRELLNPVMLAVFAHVIVAFRVLCDVGQKVKLTGWSRILLEKIGCTWRSRKMYKNCGRV